MKKLLLLLIISTSIFASTDKDTTDSDGWQKSEKTWTRTSASSAIFSTGTSEGDMKFKADFRSLILGHNLQTRFLQKKGLAFGLGAYYISSEGFCTYLETAYGTYGVNQFNGRARIGMTNDGDVATGISFTKSFTVIIFDTSLDLIHKDSGTESFVTAGIGLGF